MREKRLRLLLCAAGISLMALIQPYRPVVVVGDSMWPTLPNGSVVLLDKRSRHGRNVLKGDIVVVNVDGQIMVKRVLASDGYTVAGFLGRDEALGKHRSRVMYRVPEGHLLVVGDNRLDSYDSRDFGPVPKEAVIGKVLS